MDIVIAREVSARIWGDPNYKNVIMNPSLAEAIALLLMLEANNQEIAVININNESPKRITIDNE